LRNVFDDPLLLARMQFGLNIAFHILFHSITIALGSWLVYLRMRGNRTGEAWVERAYRLCVKLHCRLAWASCRGSR